MSVAIQERRSRAENYVFRHNHPQLRFGTASERYACWICQIYPEKYRKQISSRRRSLGGNVYEERRVPIESVADYFQHFDVLEIDFTFYRPLTDENGVPTTNHITLERYAEHAPSNAEFLLKAPQTFSARKLRRSEKGRTRYVENPEYLDASRYVTTFQEPAVQILGSRLRGVIFEQEYQRVSESPAPDHNIEELDRFFAAVPTEIQTHIELRSAHLLVPQYFDWLETRGIGFVFSHWTWLPPLRKQWRMCGERFTAADNQVVARLLTPLDVSYADAYARTHPFDRVVDEVAGTRQANNMLMDTTALAFQAEANERTLYVIANNRAWGNAPALARAVAERILREEEKRGTAERD